MVERTRIPVYSRDEVKRLLRYTLDGSLDGMHSGAKVVPGVIGCDVDSFGLRSQSLLNRFTVSDVIVAIREMTNTVRGLDLALFMLLEFNYSADTLAGAFRMPDCSSAQRWLSEAYDLFMRILLNDR
jgi:hypothetical protein